MGEVAHHIFQATNRGMVTRSVDGGCTPPLTCSCGHQDSCRVLLCSASQNGPHTRRHASATLTGHMLGCILMERLGDTRSP